MCCAALSTCVFLKKNICMYECMCLLKRFEYLYFLSIIKESNTSHLLYMSQYLLRYVYGCIY